jgi:DNA-3-methyladenine glycosylase II
MRFDPAVVAAATAHLRRKDRVLRRVIDEVGPFRMRVHRDRFTSLVDAIIAQQISGKAARSIGLKLRSLLAPDPVRPESVARMSPAELRAAGLSGRKANYLLDLSARAADGRLPLSRLGRLADDEVIELLTEVKGIGVWTAQMFLMFSLARLDVFPHGDLGIRSSIRKLYSLPELPNRDESHAIAAPWRPYATIASWYLWRNLEGEVDW